MKWCGYCGCQINEDHAGFCLTNIEYARPEWVTENPNREVNNGQAKS